MTKKVPRLKTDNKPKALNYALKLLFLSSHHPFVAFRLFDFQSRFGAPAAIAASTLSWNLICCQVNLDPFVSRGCIKNHRLHSQELLFTKD
jgi:hypothetical protein